ncbi:hypothetical protein BTN50_0264 [Candidatus Enterovibrio altilux]|uniref:Uncharacterized protein n=1 Tax=Candidatus Enterovibrio altilux TaxID=1927128 RepID=A0A291B722_9GAMM|nr:hypothetical protein BTN50_0264 [Candidatus Enterovibrio luxaltus]
MQSIAYAKRLDCNFDIEFLSYAQLKLGNVIFFNFKNNVV